MKPIHFLERLRAVAIEGGMVTVPQTQLKVSETDAIAVDIITFLLKKYPHLTHQETLDALHEAVWWSEFLGGMMYTEKLERTNAG